MIEPWVRHLSPRRLLLGSVVVAVLTIGLKTLAWYVTGSVGLLSDALESLVNLASAVFALAMVTIAQRPADDDHPYGHTKAEYFSSGFEGVMIFGAAIAIMWTAIDRLLSPQPLDAAGLGLSLSVASSVLNGGLAWVMLKAAKIHAAQGVAGAEAVDADARHLLTDVVTTAGVLVGVGAVFLTNWWWLDPVVAIGVAVNIVREGVHLMTRASHGLMDHALTEGEQRQIQTVLEGFSESVCLERMRFDHVITRRSGQRRFVDLHMHVPGECTLTHAAQMRSQVELALMDAVPGLRANIQLLPSDVEAHFHEDSESVA